MNARNFTADSGMLECVTGWLSMQEKCDLLHPMLSISYSWLVVFMNACQKCWNNSRLIGQWSKAHNTGATTKDCSLRMCTFQGGFSSIVVPSCWKDRFFHSYEKCGHYNWSSLSFLCRFHAGFLSDLFWCHSLTRVYIFDFQEVKGSNAFLIEKVSSASDVCVCMWPCHVSVAMCLCLSVFVCVCIMSDCVCCVWVYVFSRL